MPLSNTTLFKRDFPNADFTDQTIINALQLSTDILINYCNREFEYGTYTSYLSGSGDRYLILPIYPIDRVLDISTEIYDGINLTVDSGVYSATIYSDSTKLTVDITDLDGDITSTEILYADYQRMSDIVTELSAITELTVTLSSQYNNEPSRKIKPDNMIVLGGQTEYIRFYKSDLAIKFVREDKTDDVITFNRALNSGNANIYVKYRAGYIYPVEDDGESSSSESDEVYITYTVPNDLINICNKLAYTLMTEGNAENLQTGIYKSESLGDYSYTKFDNNSPVTQLLLADKNTLSKYVHKVLTF